MKHVPLASSHLASCGYEDGVLEVAFQNGSCYRYYGVPAHIFANLRGAHSPGAYLRSTIAGNYKTKKVK